MSLLGLSTELLLLIASHLRQVDLLNVSMVCKHMNVMVEPELYREYSNPRLYSRSLWTFIRRIAQRPELAKHVRRIDLFEWDYLDILQTVEHNGRIDDSREEWRKQEPSREDYEMGTQAAKSAGVIETVDPYDPACRLLDLYEARIDAHDSMNKDIPWYEHMVDDHLTWEETPYDRKFCQLLRAGIEDAQVVLLLAQLPNIQEIFLRGGPHLLQVLPWRASHKFQTLRTLTVCGTAEVVWALGNFDTLLHTTSKLEVLQIQHASSWLRALGEIEPDPSNVVPLTLQPDSLSCMVRLVLKDCMFRTVDFGNLIQACTRLKSLFYYKGEFEDGPHNPSPATVIDLLEPLKDTLEELFLDLDGALHEQAEFQHTHLIKSLSHMTTLKILDTHAEMWEDVDADELMDEGFGVDADAELPSDASRLSSRLPKSLELLIFHLDDVEVEPALSQIADVVRKRPQALPKLEQIIIGTEDPFYAGALDEILFEVEDSHAEAGLPPMQVGVEGGRIGTTFDLVRDTPTLPVTKWFTDKQKYSIRYRKPRMPAAMRKKMDEAHNEGMDNIGEAMALDPELTEYLKSHFAEPQPPLEYYDSDEENVEFGL